MSTNTGTTDTDRDRLEAELRRRIHRNLPVLFLDELVEDCGDGTVEWTPRGPSKVEAVVFKFVNDEHFETRISFGPTASDVVLVEYRQNGEWRMDAWKHGERCHVFDWRREGDAEWLRADDGWS